MKILIKESQYKVLLEQSNPNIQKAYNEIVDGAKYWMGTDKNKILKAFDYIKNIQDFKTLISMFKDKRTGYGSFEEMMNKEYDTFDYGDIVRLRDKLYSIGVNFEFDDGESILSNFNGGVKISDNNKCELKYPPILKQAQDYWKKWLSNPITKTKFLNNWKKVEKNMTSVGVETIFKKYLDAINKLKLVYYDNTMLGNTLETLLALAFVNPSEPEKIYVNCSQNDKDPYGTLIHEMQHMLYNIKPLNPDVQIADVFVNPNIKKSTPETFFNINQQSVASSTYVKKPNLKFSKQQSSESNNVNSISKQYGANVIDNLLYDAKKIETTDPGYCCRETEKMSNIIAIRSLFGVNPGQNITKEMLLPYINGKKNDTNVGWVLYCWALNDFQNLNGMLNKMNQLAYQNTKKDTFNPLNPIKNQNKNSNTRTV